jgi:hypothetical protein
VPVSATFCIFDARVPAERAKWLETWRDWPDREVYAHPAYPALYAGDGEPLCAMLTSALGTVLYPFLLRPTSTDPSLASAGTYFDLITPYGYGGPVWWGGGDPEALASEFWPAFNEWAEKSGVVAEFVRCSLFSETLLPYPGERSVRQQNFVRSLDLDDEALRMDFEHKVRKNINKATRNGLTVEIDLDGRRFDAFYAIYTATMDRREASQTYYFPREYFDAIHTNLAGQFLYAHTIHEGQIVSTELVLASQTRLYSFLGGTHAASFELRPNDLLKFEIMRWGRQNGKRDYVLGGGYSPGDGIFRYKQSFAPNGSRDFLTGSRVLDEAVYDTLVRAKADWHSRQGREWTPAEGYFPAYRSG